MAEINPFDPERDYFADLRSSEKYTDDKGNEYPYLKGLMRLAHTNRGGVRSVESKVLKIPTIGLIAETLQPDCIAAVSVTYHFNDGTSFQASADASFKAHDAPFNLHLTALAESKAEARAIRKAFAITKASKEEIGSGGSSTRPDDDDPISDMQLASIRKLAKRKKLGKADVLSLIKRGDLEDIKDLTKAEAKKAMAAINRAKAKV